MNVHTYNPVHDVGDRTRPALSTSSGRLPTLLHSAFKCRVPSGHVVFCKYILGSRRIMDVSDCLIRCGHKERTSPVRVFLLQIMSFIDYLEVIHSWVIQSRRKKPKKGSFSKHFFARHERNERWIFSTVQENAYFLYFSHRIMHLRHQWRMQWNPVTRNMETTNLQQIFTTFF